MVKTSTSKHTQERPIQTQLWDHWQYSIPQTCYSNASFSHTFSLSRSSCFWLTSPCSPRAKQPQDREKQKNTQTNDKFTTSQTSVYRSGRGQRIKRKTPSEVKCVSFQVLWSHLVAEQSFLLTTDPYMYSAMIKVNVVLQSYSVPFPIKLC